MDACLREVTAAGGTAALVDADGAFDPASAARTGVVLSRLLWVRCGGRRDAALAATDLLARCPGFVLVALDAGETAATRVARRRLSPAAGRAAARGGAAAGRPAACRGRRRDAGRAHAARRAGVGRLAARPDAAGGHEHVPSSNPQPGCGLPPSERLDERQWWTAS